MKKPDSMPLDLNHSAASFRRTAEHGIGQRIRQGDTQRPDVRREQLSFYDRAD